jgi:hypothetical protein
MRYTFGWPLSRKRFFTTPGVKFAQDPRLLGQVGLDLVEVRDGSRRVYVHE